MSETQRCDFDIQAARDSLAERRRMRRESLDRRWQRAQRDVTAIIDMLIRGFQPQRIYQWGSLLDRRRFSEISDIDIAVEGAGSAERFFAMYAAAEALTDLPLDLVEIEKLRPVHAASIRQKGGLAYERP
jgi:predicted nucleotidyltransferase